MSWHHRWWQCQKDLVVDADDVSETAVRLKHEQKRVTIVRVPRLCLVQRVTPEVLLDLALVHVAAGGRTRRAVGTRVADERGEGRSVRRRRRAHVPPHPANS